MDDRALDSRLDGRALVRGPSAVAVASSGEDGPGGFAIRDFLGLIARQRRVVSWTVVVVTLAAVAVLVLVKPRYMATALVVVDQRESQLVGLEPQILNAPPVNAAVETEVEIARSSDVLLRVLGSVDRRNYPELSLSPTLADRVKGFFGLAEIRPVAELDQLPLGELTASERAELVDKIGRIARIDRRGFTSVIAFSATTRAATTAADLANRLVDAYLGSQIAATLERRQRAAGYLRDRVGEIAGDIRKVEASIDAFVQRKLAEAGTPEQQAQIARLRDQIAQEEKIRGDKTTLAAQVETAMTNGDFASTGEVGQSVDTGRLIKQRDALAKRIARELDPEGTKNRELTTQINAIDGDLRRIVGRKLDEVRTVIADADQKLGGFRRNLKDALVGQSMSNDAVVEFYELQRNAEASRQLYDSYLARQRQVEQQTGATLSDARVVARALPPLDPVFPPTFLILAGAIACSIGIGTGLAFLRENYVGGFVSDVQVELVTGIPCLSTVPHLRRADAEATPPHDVIVAEPLSVFAESIRRIRVGLDGLCEPTKSRIVIVTSSEPGEGKSTLALALARSYALNGARALLVDADLRRPSIFRLLGLDPDLGLADYLRATQTTDGLPSTALYRDKTGLQVVLGKSPSRVATDTLIASDRFQALLRVASTSYDVIVVDTPPVGAVVDTEVMARFADALVYVIKWEATSQIAVKKGLASLTKFDTLPIGIAWMYDLEGNTQWGIVMAGVVMVILPVLILFVWTQKHLVEGIASGAVKG